MVILEIPISNWFWDLQQLGEMLTGYYFLARFVPIFWWCGWCFILWGWLWNRESQDPERLFEAADRDGSGWGILQFCVVVQFSQMYLKTKSEDGSGSCRILFDQSWKWKHEMLFTLHDLHGYSNFDQKHTRSSNLHDFTFMTSARFDHMCWSTTDIKTESRGTWTAKSLLCGGLEHEASFMMATKPPFFCGNNLLSPLCI